MSFILASRYFNHQFFISKAAKRSIGCLGAFLNDDSFAGLSHYKIKSNQHYSPPEFRMYLVIAKESKTRNIKEKENISRSNEFRGMSAGDRFSSVVSQNVCFLHKYVFSWGGCDNLKYVISAFPV